MRQIMYESTLVAKVEKRTRLAVEELAFQNRMTLGQVTRELLDMGLRAKGIAWI